jgi:dienelactone hydrolase
MPVAIVVSPPSALLDTLTAITVTGLESNAVVSVEAAMRDGAGRLFNSHATFRANGSGDVDLSSAAPISGSYSGVDAMGLIWSLAPDTGNVTDYGIVAPAGGLHITFTVTSAGATLAARTITRLLQLATVTKTEERLAPDGFYGDYFAPGTIGGEHAAIMVFGGSEGGLDDSEAALLASHGYPALSLAYFGEPGLPKTLSAIPLEYFAKALTWLAHRPGVDPSRVAVQGASRGSEAAQLLGVDFPSLVHGVIALVPSNVAICSYPGCSGPAWTLNGAAVPYTKLFGDPTPPDNPGAVIPDQLIRGPVLLDCGGEDAVWPSCAYADAIQARLTSAGFAYSHQLLNFPDAGHEVGFATPYVPNYDRALGGAAAGESAARAAQWPDILAFLSAL